MLQHPRHPGPYGFASDRLVQPGSVRYTERPGAWVVRTDEQPGYWFGNLLVLKQPPAPSELSAGLTAWDEAFADAPAVTKRLIQWEAPGDGGAAEIAAEAGRLGLSVEQDTVMMCARRPDAPPTERFSVRRVERMTDWDAVVRLGLEDRQSGPEGPVADFVRWRTDGYRALVEAGRGEYWSAWEGDQMVAAAAFFRGGELVRFQEVITHPRFRRQGACRQLCHALPTALDAWPEPLAALLVAETGSGAERVYRSVGFEPLATRVSLLGDRPSG